MRLIGVIFFQAVLNLLQKKESLHILNSNLKAYIIVLVSRSLLYLEIGFTELITFQSPCISPELWETYFDNTYKKHQLQMHTTQCILLMFSLMCRFETGYFDGQRHEKNSVSILTYKHFKVQRHNIGEIDCSNQSAV